MTVAQLTRHAITPEVMAAQECVGRAAESGVGLLDGDELATAIAALCALESQALALRLALSAEADARHLAETTADTGTDAWLSRLTGDTREINAGGLRIARLLQEKYAATRDAFAAGRLRLPQVKVIVDAAEQAPLDATAAQVATAEEWLVAKATGDANRSGRAMNASRLRQVARRMFDVLDHDLADRHEAILLGRESRTAEQETYLMLHDNGNGTYTGKFVIPELHGHLLAQALDRLTSPRRLTRDRHDHGIVDEAAPVGRGFYENRGAALCELIEHLPSTGHGPSAATVLITIDLADLLSGLGSAGLDTGTRITAGDVRRLACNAGLVPAVLDGGSVPLDLGRSRRLHDVHQRRALALLHDSCAIEGCGRPFAWCEVHHPEPWSQGGRTDLVNAVPLCGHHHRRAHDRLYDLRHHPDGTWRFHLRR